MIPPIEVFIISNTWPLGLLILTKIAFVNRGPAIYTKGILRMNMAAQ